MDELLVRERAEAERRRCRDAIRHQIAHRVLDEHLADHRGRLDHYPFVWSRSSSRAASSAWMVGGTTARSMSGPHASTRFEEDQPLVDQHREELLDEERVSLGGFDDAGPDPFVEAVPPSRCSATALVSLCEPLQLDPRRPGRRRPLGQALDELIACRADDQDRRVVRELDEVLDQLEELVSAQWMSSKRTTSGRGRASESNSLRAPQKSSLAGEEAARARSPRPRAPRPRRRRRAPRASRGRPRSSRARGSQTPGEPPLRGARTYPVTVGKTAPAEEGRSPRPTGRTRR